MMPWSLINDRQGSELWAGGARQLYRRGGDTGDQPVDDRIAVFEAWLD